MASETYCDRCGVAIHSFRHDVLLIEKTWLPSWSRKTAYDLCGDCGSGFKSWLSARAEEETR